MVNKSAQMKVQQMAFMLIAVTMFFALIGLVFIGMRLSGLKNQATTLQEQNAILLVSKLANSPEFSCGEAFGRSRVSCVDIDKVMILKDRIENYKDFWGVTNIEIRKIYPLENQEICDSSNYPNCEVLRLISGDVSGISVENFVSICRKEFDGEKTYDKCELAKLIVSYEKAE